MRCRINNRCKGGLKIILKKRKNEVTAVVDEEYFGFEWIRALLEFFCGEVWEFFKSGDFKFFVD